MDELLSVSEFAREINLSTSSVYNHIEQGLIKSIKKQVGGRKSATLIPRSELIKYKK